MVSPDCSTTWDGERFAGDLTAALVERLAGYRDFGLLARAVAESAAVAEEACLGRSMVCAAGCFYCCVLNVAVLLPEAMVIADYLRRDLAQSDLADLRARLVTHSNGARWMNDEERIIREAICPLLDRAGHCMIHPVRPLVCRAVVSLDRDRCRAAFSPIISDEVRLVPTDLLRQTVFDTAFRSLAQSLRHHGFDARSIELGAGLRAFLEYPEYCEQLLSGGRLPDELWQ